MLGMGIGTMRTYLSLDSTQYRVGLQAAAGMTRKFTNEASRTVAVGMAKMQAHHAKIGMGATMLTMMVMPLMYGVRRSEKIYGDYQVVLDKIRVVARLTESEMVQIDKNMISMGKSIGVKPTEMMKAGYIAVQSMYTDVKDIQLIAKKAAELTVSSGWETTPEKAADNLTRLLSAFGLPTTRLEEMGDLLIRTRDVGRFTMEELGDSAGKAASVMAAAFPKDKFKTMRDMMILLASGTLGGVPHNMMSTGLRSVMNAIYRESGKPKSGLNALAMQQGFGNAAGMANELGPIEFLRKMSNSTGGYLELVKQLGFGSREIQAVSVLIRNAMKNTDKAVAKLEGSKGSVAKGLEQHKKSWQALKNQVAAFKEAFVLAFGKILIRYLTAGANALLRFFEYMEKTPDFVKHFIIWAGVLLTIRSSLMVISGLLGVLSLRSSSLGLMGTLLGTNVARKGVNGVTIGGRASGGLAALLYGAGVATRGFKPSAFNVQLARTMSNIDALMFGVQKKTPVPKAIPSSMWSNSKYAAISALTGYSFGHGNTAGTAHGLIPDDLRGNKQFMGFMRNSKYAGYSSDDMVRAYREAHRNVKFDPVTGYGRTGRLNDAIRDEFRKALSSANKATLPVLAASSATGASTAAVLTRLPKSAGLLLKALGWLYVGFSIFKGWWSSVSEGFLESFRNVMEIVSPLSTIFSKLGFSGVDLFNVFISLAVGVETVVDVLKAAWQGIFGFGLGVANLFPTIYRAIDAWLHPGNKMAIDPKTGRYKQVWEKNWAGVNLPAKNSRMDAFSKAFTDGLAQSGAIIGGAKSDLLSKETWDKIMTSKQWRFPYSTTEVIPAPDKKVDDKDTDGIRPGQEPKYATSREYAGAYLYGSADAWNARLPYYLSKSESTELQKQQLTTMNRTYEEIKKIRQNQDSNNADVSSDEIEGADFGS